MRRALALLAVAATLGAAGGTATAAPPDGPRLAVSSVQIHFPHKGQAGSHAPTPSDLFSGNLFTVDAFGEARQTVVGSSGKPGLLPFGSLDWAPDGSLLVFEATKLRNFATSLSNDLYVVGADGSGLRRLTRVRNATSPVFSADGKTVFFARLRAPRNSKTVQTKKGESKVFLAVPDTSSIWAVGIDGSALHRVTPVRKGVLDAPSSVSPLTGDLAFSSQKCRHGRCTASARLLSLQNGTESLIANHAANPVFSPDGNRIALESYRDHNWTKPGLGPTPELYVRDQATAAMRRLTFSRNIIDGPASWDPSGSRLAYIRFGLTLTGISEINPDGTCGTPLPTLAGNGIFGRTFIDLGWQPGPGRGAGPAIC